MSVHDDFPPKKETMPSIFLALDEHDSIWTEWVEEKGKKIGKESVFTEFQILIIFYLKKDTQGSSSEPFSPKSSWAYVMIAQHII